MKQHGTFKVKIGLKDPTKPNRTHFQKNNLVILYLQAQFLSVEYSFGVKHQNDGQCGNSPNYRSDAQYVLENIHLVGEREIGVRCHGAIHHRERYIVCWLKHDWWL